METFDYDAPRTGEDAARFILAKLKAVRVAIAEGRVSLADREIDALQTAILQAMASQRPAYKHGRVWP